MINNSRLSFVRTGNETYLGDKYAGYWLAEVIHLPTNKRGDILVDSGGDLVKWPNEITALIEENFCLNGLHAEIIQFAIDGHAVLAMKWPPVPKS